MNINCKSCENPFGTLNNKVLKIDFKRVNNIEHDFENNSSKLKCRKCSTVSVLKFDSEFSNEVDHKSTSRQLLG